MNINDTPSILDLMPSEADINECVKQGKKREPDCQNHIKVVELVGPNDLLVCGTGAYNPKQYRVKAASLTLYNDTKSTFEGKGVCPYDPFDRVVSLLSVDRNDSGKSMIYTGVYDDFLKTDPYILRQPLFFSTHAKTVPKIKTGTEPDWLNRPHFVGGSDVGEEALFFFREEGKYCLRPEKKIFSRVAKVCKSDPGYYDMYWISYQKTRLLCRMPGDHEDFYHIEDIAEVDDVFYALFTKSFEEVKASVVCSFNKNAILKSFVGKYQASCSNNGRVRSSTQEHSMSGSCGVFRNQNNSFSSMYKNENFLMEQELRGSNVFYIKDVVYTDIEVSSNISGQNDTTIFAASNGGQIHEILVQFPPSNSVSRIYNIFYGTEEVRSLIYFRDHLYISSDSSVIQVNIRCAKYEKSEDCRSDPKCTWCTSAGCKSDQTSCSNGSTDEIRSKKVDIKINLGSTTFLEINQTLPNSEPIL
ncbi:hypothetical protein ACJMK2_024223 [Sinanodonta woodiana]|uniref:Sema domain-containing protein n=1 Tax=Sinanodonta woodiana TaxID=1069815 RepID=A0ABD3T7M3_SINWO